MKILISVGAVLAGMCAAGFGVAIVEGLNMSLYPELAEAAARDAGALKRVTIPIGALVVVLAAWCVGAVLGSFVTTLITAKFAGLRNVIPAYAFGLLFLGACLATLFAIPHPTWFAVLGIVGPAVLVMVTAKATARAFYRPTA